MPLLSSIGGGSAYAYRGNYDDWPNPFSFQSQLNLIPGTVATATTTITGINYKSVIQGTNNVLISVNGGSFISSPQFVRNNQTVTLRYQTDLTGSDGDFNKTFTTTVSIGKRSASWTVTTKVKDNNPVVFTFDDVNQTEVSTAYESNIVSIAGIEPGFSTFAFISSGTATFSVNGGPYVTSAFVNNGDTIRMRQVSSPFYSTSAVSQISVGDYSTTFTVKTRNVDVTVNPFTFTSVTNANLNTEQTSNNVTISGADSGIPLAASIQSPGLISVNSSPTFVSGPVTVNNGDTIRVRIPASAFTEYSKTTTISLNVSGTIGTYSVTTRPRPIKTFPNSFSFTAITGAEIQTVIESNVITLSGMTTGDAGTATISGSSAEFKVTRNGTVVRNYSSSSFPVLNGDQIQLRITSGGELANVQATFTVSGTDTSTNISGVSGSTSANWLVTSKSLTCTAASFAASLTPVKTNVVGQLRSVSFVISGLNAGCDNIVTTSDANSYLRVNGSQATSLAVSNGDTVEVYMTSPAEGATRTTTITVRRPSGVNAVSGTWSIETTARPIVNISLSPSSIYTGNSATLSWSTSFATTIVSSSFGASALSGSINVNPSTTTTYSLTVSGEGGQTSGSATLTVSPPPPTVSLNASPTSVAYNGNTTLTWSSSGATSVVSSNFGAGSLNGNATQYNLTSSKTYTITVTGAGGNATASAFVSVASCSPQTKQTSFARYKFGTIYYGNGSAAFPAFGASPPYPFFVSSTSAAASTPLPNRPQFTYAQVQDYVAGYYTGRLGRPVEEAAVSPTGQSWVTVFNNNPSQYPDLNALGRGIQIAYDNDPPNGSGEASFVRSNGGRDRILDSCGNTWTAN